MNIKELLKPPPEALTMLDDYPDLYELVPGSEPHLKALGLLDKHIVKVKNRYIVRNVLDGLAALTQALEGEPGAMADGFRLAAKLFNLTEQTRTVMGQDDDGTPNGKDYSERRTVSEWTQVTPQGDTEVGLGGERMDCGPQTPPGTCRFWLGKGPCPKCGQSAR